MADDRPAKGDDRPALADIAAKLAALPERIAKWVERRALPDARRGVRPSSGSPPAATGLPPAAARPPREFSLGAAPTGPAPAPARRPPEAPDVWQDEPTDLFGHTHRLFSAAAPFSPTLGRVGGLLGRIDDKRRQAANLHAAFKSWQAAYDKSRAGKDAPRVREGAESADLSRLPPLPRIEPNRPPDATRGEARHAPPVLLTGATPEARPADGENRAPASPPAPPAPPAPVFAPLPIHRRDEDAPPAGGAPPRPFAMPSAPARPGPRPALGAAAGGSAFGPAGLPGVGATAGAPMPFAGSPPTTPGQAQTPGQGGPQSMKVTEDRLADIKDLLSKMLGSQEGHGPTAISSLAQGHAQGVQRRTPFGQAPGPGGQGRRRSAEDADGIKWSRRAGAFAGEFVKTLAEG